MILLCFGISYGFRESTGLPKIQFITKSCFCFCFASHLANIHHLKYLYLIKLTLDLENKWILWQEKHCRQFRLLTLTLFIGQFVYIIGGECWGKGGVVIFASLKFHFIGVRNNLVQDPINNKSINLAHNVISVDNFSTFAFSFGTNYRLLHPVFMVGSINWPMFICVDIFIFI